MKRKPFTAAWLYWSLSLVSMLVYMPVWKIKALAFTKAFSIVWLLVLALHYAGSTLTRRTKWIVAGLAFGLAGDIFLVPQGGVYLISGLLCFFIGHILYTIAFYTKARINIRLALILSSIGISIAILLIYFLIQTHRYYLIIPVILYCAVIFTMTYFALLSQNKYIQWGAVLFIVSDFSLSIMVFVTSFFGEQALVWISYYCAQALFTQSIRFDQNSSSVN